MKSLFHSFLLPLVAGFLLFSCTQETPKSEMSTSVPPSKAGRMIQLQIESGVTLPEVEYPTKPRLSRVDLDISHSKYRPSVNFSKTALQTRLYLRKKGSTRPEDIFCVIIRPQDWTKKTVENRKLILQGLSTGISRLLKMCQLVSLLLNQVSSGRRRPSSVVEINLRALIRCS